LSAATSAQKEIAVIIRTTELVTLASARSANFASPSLPTRADITVAEMVAAIGRGELRCRIRAVVSRCAIQEFRGGQKSLMSSAIFLF
jgi:hypothetical protein